MTPPESCSTTVGPDGVIGAPSGGDLDFLPATGLSAGLLPALVLGLVCLAIGLVLVIGSGRRRTRVTVLVGLVVGLVVAGLLHAPSIARMPSPAAPDCRLVEVVVDERDTTAGALMRLLPGDQAVSISLRIENTARRHLRVAISATPPRSALGRHLRVESRIGRTGNSEATLAPGETLSASVAIALSHTAGNSLQGMVTQVTATVRATEIAPS